MRKRLHFCWSLVALCWISAALAAHQVPAVRVDGGLIEGFESGGVRTYLGVPYAAAPIGALRWREPQPVHAWPGVRPAVAYGASCMQAKEPQGQPSMSEDCLFLNVWAPESARPSDRLPVVVYLHGAGFNSGSASSPRIAGENLARRGLVVVNMNYRLGVMGGLALPELTAESAHRASGNYLHLDQIAALRWVRRNIAHFGGDPGNVTLMGQSSGSIDVSVLQASPLARGLFRRVVALSGSALLHGGPWPAWSLPEAEQHGQKVEAAAGVRSLAELRALPASGIIAHAKFYFPVGADGYVLSEHPAEIFAGGKQNDVPTFVGNTRDESFSALATVRTAAGYRAWLGHAFPTEAGELLHLYPASNDAQAQQAAVQLANNGEFARQMTQWARLQSRTGRAPAYLYEFRGAEGASAHGRDVAYWFGTLDAPDPSGLEAHFPAPTAADRALSVKMMALLVAYARTGKPTTGRIVAPRYERAHEKVLELGDPIRVRSLAPGVDYLLDHPQIVLGIGEPGRNPLVVN